MRSLCTLVFIAALGCGSSDVSRELGARCSVMADCDERCLPPGDPEFPEYAGGFCTVSCLGDSDCPEGSACTDVEGGVCMFTCAELGDCSFLGLGWECQGAASPDEGRVMVCLGVGE